MSLDRRYGLSRGHRLHLVFMHLSKVAYFKPHCFSSNGVIIALSPIGSLNVSLMFKHMSPETPRERDVMSTVTVSRRDIPWPPLFGYPRRLIVHGPSGGRDGGVWRCDSLRVVPELMREREAHIHNICFYMSLEGSGREGQRYQEMIT